MRARARVLTLAGIALLIAPLGGCDKNDPTSPTDATVTVSANPSTVDFGTGTTADSQIRATVLDADGNPVSGVSVRFTTDSGTMLSGGSSRRTNSDGEATDTLRLTDEDDPATVTAKSGTKTGSVTVGIAGVNTPPTAVASISAATTKTNQNVTFTGSGSTDPEGATTIANWKWTLTYTVASGTPPAPEVLEGDRSTRSVFIKSFPTARHVDVQLQVTDAEGAASFPVVVAGGLTVFSNFPPTAVITGGPSVAVNVPITLSGATSHDDSREPTGAIVRYDWDWGDLTTPDTNLTVPTMSHTYSSTGTFTVHLKVYDNGDGTVANAGEHLYNDNATDEKTLTITVTP